MNLEVEQTVVCVRWTVLLSEILDWTTGLHGTPRPVFLGSVGIRLQTEIAGNAQRIKPLWPLSLESAFDIKLHAHAAYII